MPLTKSPTKEAFSSNVAEMIKAGHPRAQALAASYATARKAGAKFKDGGAPKKSAVHLAREIQRRAKAEHMADGGDISGGQPPAQSFTDKLLQTWPARLAQTVWQAAKLPGDVYQGNIPIADDSGHTNPEVINRSADLANLAMTGPLGAPRGVIGSGLVRPAENAVSRIKLTPAEREYFNETIKPQYALHDDVPSARLNNGYLEFDPQHAQGLSNWIDEGMSWRGKGERVPPSFHNDTFLNRIEGAPPQWPQEKMKRGGTVAPKKSAVRIASEIQRRAKAEHMAAGGIPYAAREESRGLMHEGMINSPVPGRTDRIPMNVQHGSYVVPSAAVSGIGEGNSLAGAHALNRLFKMGPYGSSQSSIHVPGVHRTSSILRQHFRKGGSTGTPIVAAGGEVVIPPEKLIEVFGDLNHAHEVMDEFVKHVVKKTSKQLAKLPPPKTR